MYTSSRFRVHGPRAFALATIGFALVAMPARAQRGTPPPAKSGQPAMATPAFDPKTVETVDGTVIAIDTLLPMSGMPGRGIHATLKSKTETLPVHIGPMMYLATQPVKLAVGNVVRVTGSRVIMSTVPTILAISIVRGKDTLALREANGIPRWRGMRMGKQPMGNMPMGGRGMGGMGMSGMPMSGQPAPAAPATAKPKATKPPVELR
jgi:hypothetical protein